MPRARLNVRAAGPVTGQPLWRAKAAARSPRAAFLIACAVLAVVGVRTLVSPKPLKPAEPRAGIVVDAGAQSFAEAFARAYLTWDAESPESHERAVGRFLARGVEPSAGLLVPQRGSQHVRWTAVAADRRAGDRGRIVTVAAETSQGLLHLAVRVSRDPRGMLFVSAVPAVVGPPARTTTAAARPEAEVEDRQLRAVAARVVRNYLAGERDDLVADLDPRAVVSLPDMRLTVRSTDAVTWVSEPHRIAIAVTADARGALRLALRYELSVLRVGGRWVVRTIHTNPIAREGNR